jgi:hypothetical protein
MESATRMTITLDENECRSICRAIKLRADELSKEAKKLLKLDRPTEARNLTTEAEDLTGRLGPKFDAQGTFDFKAAAQKDAIAAAKARNKDKPTGGAK